MIHLTIPGRPVPAVRMTQRSMYKSKQALRYLAYKHQVGWAAKAAGVKDPSAKDIEVTAIAYLCPKLKDIDVDNLGKAYLDGLNKIAWIDDKQVVKLTVEKRFVPHVDDQMSEINIREVV